MVHSISGWMRGVQVKLWDPLRMRAIPERLRGVFATRRYTNSRLPYLTCASYYLWERECVLMCMHPSSYTKNLLTQSLTNCLWESVASLEWVTPRAATEGITPLFFLKNLAIYFLVASSAVSPLMTFFAHHFIAFYCFHSGVSGVSPSRVSPYTFFTCPTSFIQYSL